MFGFIKKLFGTKYDRDEKHYMPFVNQINEEFSKLQGLDNLTTYTKTIKIPPDTVLSNSRALSH